MTIEIPKVSDLEALALARRNGWPDELRVLLVRYPRGQWEGHPNLGGMARFWLSRHAMFRELAAAIEEIAAQFHAGKLPAAEFARHFVPRLQFLLNQLNVHHQIEDLHYFPIFRAADERLARGDGDAMAEAGEMQCGVAADEAGAADDEDVHGGLIRLSLLPSS